MALLVWLSSSIWWRLLLYGLRVCWIAEIAMIPKIAEVQGHADVAATRSWMLGGLLVARELWYPFMRLLFTRCRLTMMGMLFPSRWPYPIPAVRPMSSGHHISMEHRLRRKHLLLNPKAAAAFILKKEKEKRRTTFSRKTKKNKLRK